MNYTSNCWVFRSGPLFITNDYGKPQSLSDAVGRAALSIHFINFLPFINFLDTRFIEN